MNEGKQLPVDFLFDKEVCESTERADIFADDC